MTFLREISDVGELQVVSSNVICSGTVYKPTIAYKQHAYFPVWSSYAWMEIPVTQSNPNPNFFVIENLIPGQTYYTRVMAKNDLGYGKRRLTAPPSIVVPVTQPAVVTAREGAWSPPNLYVATATSLLVKIGPPGFDGGSLATHFNVEWDLSPSFDSGVSGTALGTAVVPAYTVLCRTCVSAITFEYNVPSPVVTVTFQGSSTALLHDSVAYTSCAVHNT